MFKFLKKEIPLRMSWEVKAHGKATIIIGASHLFPHDFSANLRRLISKARKVILEGPVDNESLNAVVEKGKNGKGSITFGELLGPELMEEIFSGFFLKSFCKRVRIITEEGLVKDLKERVQGMSPWLGFFTFWYNYLHLRGWNYSLDREVMEEAKRQLKPVFCLEEINEQIEALRAIPNDRILGFLKEAERWDDYMEKYRKFYLAGDLENLMLLAQRFPTFCDSVIFRRDPILFERMLPYLEEGDGVIVVGITHMKGILDLTKESGLECIQLK